MKNLGSLLISILVGLVLLWLAFKLLVGALKLFGILLAIAVVGGGYLMARRRLGGPRG